MARRSARYRQGYRPLPHDLLADIPNGSRAPASEAGARSPVAAFRRGQDEQIQGQRYLRRRAYRSVRARPGAVFPAFRDGLFQRREHNLRIADKAHERRFGEHAGQSGFPHGRYDKTVFRRRDTRQRRDRRRSGAHAEERGQRQYIRMLREVRQIPCRRRFGEAVQRDKGVQQVYRRDRAVGACQGRKQAGTARERAF